jgi:hypothetical protein
MLPSTTTGFAMHSLSGIRLRVLIASLMPLISCLPSAAHAQQAWYKDPPPRVIEDRVRVELGAAYGSIDTLVRLDPSLTVKGTSLSGEKDLGLAETRVIPMPELTFLPGRHHLIRLSAMTIRRHADHTLNRTILFDNNAYFVNEKVESELNLSMLGITYGYRFIRAQRAELTGLFGIEISQIEANVIVRTRLNRAAESGVAPLPMAGLEGRFDISSRWSLEGRVQYLSANISDVSGTIHDWRLDTTWRMNPHFKIGLGYRDLDIDVDSKDAGTPGHFTYKQKGPELFMRASL